MGTEAQLIAKFSKERAKLLAQRDVITERLEALDQTIAGLRALNGEKVGKPVSLKATDRTGTKAHILDVLADGQKRARDTIAEAIKVKLANTGYHLKGLVKSGDVKRIGKSHATRYFIP